MELIERYVYAVTRHLAKDQREDVANELRATIEDMVAEKSKGKKHLNSTIESVLQELGKPEVLAFKYGHTKRYLIGPKWFDAYFHLLKKLLYIVPVIVATIMSVINILIENMLPVPAIVNGVGGGVAAAIQVAFWTTLTFAIMERTGVNPDDMYDAQTWTPKELPELPQKRQISRVDAIASIVMIVIAGVWIAFAPIVSMPWWQVGAPMLNPELWSFWVPLFLGLSVLLVVQELMKLKIGNWVPMLVVSNVVLNIVIATGIVLLVTTQEVMNPAFVAILIEKGAQDLHNALQWTAAITVIITLVSCAWNAVESVYKTYQLRSRQ
jgi:hypothetical protein